MWEFPVLSEKTTEITPKKIKKSTFERNGGEMLFSYTTQLEVTNLDRKVMVNW